MKTKHLILPLLALLASVSAFAYDAKIDGIYYNFTSDAEASVTYKSSVGSGSYNSYSGQIIIPESITYQGITYSVTSIGREAFKNCSNLTYVTIPESVTSICDYAFQNCTGLKSVTISGNSELRAVTIPNSVTRIGGGAFYDCSGLTSVTIPESVTSIGGSAFYKTAWWDNQPDGLVYLGKAVLGYKSTMPENTEIIIKDGTSVIADYAFAGFTGLTAVTIPSSVTHIGEEVLVRCSSLTSIEVDSENTIYDSRDNCNAIIETATNTLIQGCQNTIIPNGVTSIGGSAFSGCKNLTSITIPNSVTSIGESAFYDCSSLTVITIPEGVTSIGSSAFSGCSSLASVTIQEGVTSIGGRAFSGCSSLTSVTIPSSVTSIGGSAFSGCKNLTSITIPNSVTSIGGNAFYGCSSLTSVIIPEGVTSIGNSAFRDCSSLTSVTIPEGVTSIGNYAFSGCSSLTSVTIPNSVTSIGSWTFYNCSSLTAITIPEGVTSIGEEAFCNCKNLNSITIPNSVTSIGRSAFLWTAWYDNQPDGLLYLGKVAYTYKGTMPENTEIIIKDGTLGIAGWAFASLSCRGLTSITFPSSLKSIGDNAFAGCTRLIAIYCYTQEPPEVSPDSSPFSNVDIRYVTLFVPKDSYQQYKDHWLWGGFDPIMATLDEIKNITFADPAVKALCVAHWDTNGDDELSKAEAAAVTDLGEVFKDNTTITSFDELHYFTGLTSIGHSAFAYCSGLTSITIPEGVTSIGDQAFRDCSGLTSITIPGSVTSIGHSVFAYCSGLTSITIPSNLTSIDGNAFFGCSGLNSIKVASGNTFYDSRDNCNAIIETATNTLIAGCHNTTIPNSVTSIGGDAFCGCSSLTSITIPNSVTSIGNDAFYGTSLTTIVIPDNVQSIGYDAFGYCCGLTSITIGRGLTSIAYPFRCCTSLTSVNVDGDNPVFDSRENCNAIIETATNTLVAGCMNTFIPNGVTSIGDEAFWAIYGLTSITIPYSVTNIGNRAFSACNLTDVYCEAEQIPNTGSDVFSDEIMPSATLHVPAASLKAYSTTAPWSGFGTIVGLGGQYRYYNLVITGIKGGSTGTIQFSEFDLLDDSSNEVEALSIYAGITNSNNEKENWPSAADNDLHTKYCYNFNGNSYFLFDAKSRIKASGYRFYTANDNDRFPERSPKSWKLYGSNTKLTDPTDAGWVLLDVHNNDTIIQNVCNTPFDFYFGDVTNMLLLNKASITLMPDDKLQLQASNRLRQNLTLQWTSNNEGVASVNNQGLVTANSPGTASITVTAAEDNTLSASCIVTVVSTLPGHRYYQFAIEAISGGSVIQLSEFDLIDINGNEIEPLSTYAHTGNSFNGEEQEKLFDDNTNTKYCGNFSVGTTLYIFIDAGKRVSLSGYRVTTGGDTGGHPERNPISWSLLGSNTQSSLPDDAVWTLLDHHENDKTLGAYDRASYDFLFTYPCYIITDATTSLNITTGRSEVFVDFTHNFTGDWESLYLPFAIDYHTIKDNFDLAEIDGVVQHDQNNDGIADITVLSIIGFGGQMTEANKPYLIRAKHAGEQTITSYDATIYPTEEVTFDCASFSTKYEFTGSYKRLYSSTLKNRYIVQDGELVKGASKLSPCRWYMTATSRNGAPLNLPNNIRIMPVDEVITGVQTLSDSPLKGEDIYNLSGQRLQKMQHGINIVGGKKVMVK